jgi:hypothetical protein
MDKQQDLQTNKGYTHNKLKAILENSRTYNEFLEKLEKENIQIYRVGNTFGFTEKTTDYRYRLETLGLQGEFKEFIKRTDKKKTFSEKVKDLGKRLLHEIVNDVEHLVTGKKPEMENKIWTQERAGQRNKDKNGYIKKGFDEVKETYKEQELERKKGIQKELKQRLNEVRSGKKPQESTFVKGK